MGNQLGPLCHAWAAPWAALSAAYPIQGDGTCQPCLLLLDQRLCLGVALSITCSDAPQDAERLTAPQQVGCRASVMGPAPVTVAQAWDVE